MASEVKSEYRDIVKLFSKLTGSRSMWQVFNDVITMIACAIQNGMLKNPRFDEIEEKYTRVSKEYTDDEMEVIANIFGAIINTLEANPFQDFLGDLYMNLEMGSSATGQFFTPYNISKAIANSALDKEGIKSALAKKGYITMLEPAAGGGANVIAGCEALKEMGVNYQEKCVIVCQELSELTALMCYIALSLIGCNAVVKIGDSLINPYTNYRDEEKAKSNIWTTPMFWIYGGNWKV